MSTQGVFDLLGLSELRDHGVALPRRRTIAFGNAAVTDDASRRTTRVGPNASAAVVAERETATLGNDDDWTRTVNDGGVFRIYDPSGGDWFGRGIDYALASYDAAVLELTTAPVADPQDYLVIEGLSTVVQVTRKILINHGPGIVWFRSPAGTLYPGSVRAPMCFIAPGAAAVLMLDPIDLRWLVRAQKFAGFG